MIISFYRGVWCHFCDTALDALAHIDDAIRALGAIQVAIGPPPGTDDQRRRLGSFAMRVLIDRGLLVAHADGLTITLPDELREPYAQAGCGPPGAPESGGWRLPIPATHVVDRTARIALAAIDVDYRNHLDPTEILSTLRRLLRRASGNPGATPGRPIPPRPRPGPRRSAR